MQTTMQTNVKRRVARSWSLEWREHGRWVKSAKLFTSPESAKEHAEIIGCAGCIIRVLSSHDESGVK